MSGLCCLTRAGLIGRVLARLVVSLGIVSSLHVTAFSQEAANLRPDDDTSDPNSAWTWVEHCHVQKSHKLSDFGTFGSLLVTGDAQMILSHPSAGRNRTGYSYIASLKQNLWRDAALIGYAEGGTSYTLDHVIHDSLGTNNLVQPADAYLSHLFVLQNLPAHDLQLVAGRVDLSDFFDTNGAANCEITQFLSKSLVNNPTISFPQAGMGAAGKWSPASWMYVQGAAADAFAVATESGFDTAFHSSGGPFSIFEIGVSPSLAGRSGTYRFMFWRKPASGPSQGGPSPENHGFALSFDQSLTKSLTLFSRYGTTDVPVGGIRNFWSVGAHLKGPLPGRRDDFLQCGLARGNAVPQDETLIEIGYNVHATDHLAITPIMQVFVDPAQDPRDETAVVAGLRAVYVF